VLKKGINRVAYRLPGGCVLVLKCSRFFASAGKIGRSE